MRVQFEPIKPHIGAIVHVERQALCDDDVVGECLAQVEDRGVLVFPRLGLSDLEQLAFTDRLGGRINYFQGAPAVAQDVYTVTLDAEINSHPDTVQGTYFWHIDGTTQAGPPPKASLLSMRRVAPKGGQTEFASTFSGYENLSAADKAEIAGLRAVHTIYAGMRPVTDTPTAEQIARWEYYSVINKHPIVWTQKSGRRSLVIGQSADYVLDVPLPDGRALLARLLDWTVQPDFRYRHEWQVGDLIIWNNYGVVHRALPYDPNSGRMIHRTTVAGVEHIN